MPESFEEERQQARRNRYLLVLPARSLEGLTIRESQAFDAIVLYARWREERPEPVFLPGIDLACVPALSAYIRCVGFRFHLGLKLSIRIA